MMFQISPDATVPTHTIESKRNDKTTHPSLYKTSKVFYLGLLKGFDSYNRVSEDVCPVLFRC